MKKYRESHNSDCLVIYSMWEGYLKLPNNTLQPLLDGFQNTVHLHTSGHATPKAIADICCAVSPAKAIIPIHSANPEMLGGLGLPFHIEYPSDGQVYEI